jgi:putative hydrolase of the HAD superfamily
VPADTATLRLPAGQTLLFDADDTLWENNIYFERAISSFISYLDHRVHTPEEVREHLNRVERATIKAHGYGLKSFRKSLIACFEQLTDKPVTPEKHARIVSFAQSIADHEIELLAGVPATIADLATRHRCILVTTRNSATNCVAPASRPTSPQSRYSPRRLTQRTVRSPTFTSAIAAAPG